MKKSFKNQFQSDTLLVSGLRLSAEAIPSPDPQPGVDALAPFGQDQPQQARQVLNRLIGRLKEQA